MTFLQGSYMQNYGLSGKVTHFMGINFYLTIFLKRVNKNYYSIAAKQNIKTPNLFLYLKIYKADKTACSTLGLEAIPK